MKVGRPAAQRRARERQGVRHLGMSARRRAYPQGMKRLAATRRTPTLLAHPIQLFARAYGLEA